MSAGDDGPSETRRRVLATVAGGTSAALAGCAGLLDESGTAKSPDQATPAAPAADRPATGTQTATSPTATEPASGPIASARVADADAAYPTMGSADADATATLFGGWKCPFTRQFVRRALPSIVREYVQPGDVAIRFRAVRFQAGSAHGRDEPRANRVGQAVWHAAPERFWAYFAVLYERQPPESERWATTDRLQGFARAAGIDDTDPLRAAATGDRYQDVWQRTQRRVGELGITGLPRLRLGGEITAPTLEPRKTKEQLDRAAR
ncbi:MAG: DsbA family protein [Haloarculaceae archaeon]